MAPNVIRSNAASTLADSAATEMPSTRVFATPIPNNCYATPTETCGPYTPPRPAHASFLIANGGTTPTVCALVTCSSYAVEAMTAGDSRPYGSTGPLPTKKPMELTVYGSVYSRTVRRLSRLGVSAQVTISSGAKRAVPSVVTPPMSHA